MKSFLTRSFFFLVLLGIQLSVFAQQDLKQTNNELKNWFSQNWQWVIGGGLVLLLIIVASSGRKKSNRKTTTVVKDDYGNVKSVTSTEVRE